MSPMRPIIVYFGGFALPNRNAACHRAYANAKLIGQFGIDTRIVGFEPADSTAVRRMAPTKGGIGLLALPTKSGKLPIVSSFRLNPGPAIHYLKCLGKRRRIAGVICYNYPSIAQAGLQAYCRLNGIRYISDVTEWNSGGGLGAARLLLKSVDNSVRIRILNWMGDGIITTAPFVTAYYGKFGNSAGELPTLFDKTTLVTRPHSQPPPGAPVRVMFVGPGFDVQIPKAEPKHLKERIDLIVRLAAAAIDSGRDFYLDVFGLTREQFSRHFPDDASIADHCHDRIAFHGRVSHETILEALLRADFSIILRDNKRANNAGFPTKFAESLTAGTPVIIDRIESLAAYHQHPHVILIDRTNPVAMARSLLQKIEDYRLRESRNPSPLSTFQTFDYTNFRHEMAKAIGQ
jgi:glycosyltransferase involved in cell wall biosynthesis